MEDYTPAADRRRQAPGGSMNLVLALLGGAAAVVVGSRLFNLNALQKELQIDQSVKLDPSTGSDGINIKLRVAITLKNPTKGSITVKRPVTSIFFNDNEIGTSDTISNRDYIIPEFGQVTLEPYLITVSALSAGIAAFDFIKQLGKSRTAVVKARSLTLINGSIPYAKETLVTLSK